MNQPSKKYQIQLKVAAVFATAFGSGLAPIAPGTFGSLFGAGLVYFLLPLSVIEKVLIWIVIFALSIWSSHIYDRESKTKDNSKIVIDEVVGMGISTALATNATEIFIAFILFRIFDIWKPPPIQLFDRMSKTSAGANGLAVVLDDVVAGGFALSVYLVLIIFLKDLI